MRKWSVFALAVVLAGSLGGYFGFGRSADAGAQDCDDYVTQTNERVNEARQLLYPGDRPDAFQGGPEEAAQVMSELLVEHEEAQYPDGGENIHFDITEAMNTAIDGLIGSGQADPTIQITFAKSIIYNADARLVTLVETC